MNPTPILIKLSCFVLGLTTPLAAILLLGLILKPDPLAEHEKRNILNVDHLNTWSSEIFCRPLINQTKRSIVVLGGSSAQGVGVRDDQSFSYLLSASLSDDLSQDWQVKNLAMAGKNSAYMSACVDQATPNDKIWIIYEGHNDFINLSYAGPEKMAFFYQFPWVTRAFFFLLDQPFAGLLRSVLKRQSTDLYHSSWSKKKHSILRFSEKYLREILSKAEARQVTVILTTVVSNLSFKPIRLHWRDSPSIESAAAHFDKAEQFAEKKLWSQAQEEYQKALDADPNMQRATSEYNDLIRRLGQEKNVIVVDLAKEILKDFPRRKIGCDFFTGHLGCDAIHPGALTHKWIAQKLAPVVRKTILEVNAR